MKTIGRAAGLPGESVTGVLHDNHGRLWAVARGLYVATDAQAETFEPVAAPTADTFRSIFQDREGTYWIGTAGNGAIRMRPSAFRNIPAGGFTVNDSVRSITRDAEGNLWAGLPGRGVVRVAPDGKNTNIETGTGRDGDIWSVFAAKDGTTWIGTRGALFTWRQGMLKKFPEYTAVRVSMRIAPARSGWARESRRVPLPRRRFHGHGGNDRRERFRRHGLRRGCRGRALDWHQRPAHPVKRRQYDLVPTAARKFPT